MKLENEELPSLSQLIHQLGVRVQQLREGADPSNESTLLKLDAAMEFVNKALPLAQGYEKTSFPKLYAAKNIFALNALKDPLNRLDNDSWMPKITTKDKIPNETEYQLCKAMTDTITTIKNNSEKYFPDLTTKQDKDLKSTIGIMQGAGELRLMKAKPELVDIVETRPLAGKK
ncbi:MAG: hypothetical protein K2X50_09350 [Gammaproteobacteria bacterium]|nr:hypothetical protein [Gammaproteobacteria bacterium]